MIDAYVTTLPGSALGAIGGALAVVGLSLIVGVVLSAVALVAGALVERAFAPRASRRPVLGIVEAGERARAA